MMLQAVAALAFSSVLLLVLTGISLAVRAELPAIRRALGVEPQPALQPLAIRRRRVTPPRAAMLTAVPARSRAAG